MISVASAAGQAVAQRIGYNAGVADVGALGTAAVTHQSNPDLYGGFGTGAAASGSLIKLMFPGSLGNFLNNMIQGAAGPIRNAVTQGGAKKLRQSQRRVLSNIED
jgi:filamentous hemagglutinin